MYEIEIFGSIVQDKTKDNQVTMTEIRNQLKDADGAEVLLLINSGGGSTINGSAILDEMDRYQGTINAHIMGICASMATQIASKCQSVSMNSNALYMIHNSQSMARGEAKDLEAQASLMRSVNTSMALNYMAKTGLSEDTVRSMMDKTTYMTAQEAYDLGFVDEITDAVEMVAEFKDYILGSEEIPEQAKAYFKQEQTETNMSEEKQEKGKLWDAVVALVTGKQPEVTEPVQEEVVAEVPAIDCAAKCVEIEADFSAKLEAKEVELEKLKASHEEAMEAKSAELADVVSKSEAIV